MIVILHHSYIGYDDSLNKFMFQVGRVKAKVTVAVFRKHCHGSSAFIYGLILI